MTVSKGHWLHDLAVHFWRKDPPEEVSVTIAVLLGALAAVCTVVLAVLTGFVVFSMVGVFHAARRVYTAVMGSKAEVSAEVPA